MYLKFLKEEAKELFLKLSCLLASSDGNFDKEEKLVISSYCNEMGISFFIPSLDFDADDIITSLDNICEYNEKKILIFETLGLALVDNNYDVAERDIVNKLALKFGLDMSYVEECEKMIREYYSFQDKVNRLVMDK